MTSIKINLGRGKVSLKKSNQLIGVIVKSQTSSLPKELSEKKLVHRWLGGFRIYKVGRSQKAVEKVLNSVRKHKNVQLGTHVYFKADSDKPIVPTGNIVISFNSSATKKDRKALLETLHLKKGQVINAVLMTVSVTKDSPNPLKCCAILEESPIVAQASPDFDVPLTHYAFSMPKEDLFPLQWHLQNKGAAPGEPKGKIIKGADMRVIKAWKRLGNKGSGKIRIAVVDSGFDLQHPAYKDRIVNTYSIYADPFQQIGTDHGTACTGLAAASETGEGMIGVAPNVELILIDGSSFAWSSLQLIFKFCMDNAVDIISCSWGGQEFLMGHDPMHDHVFREVTTQGRNGKGCVVLFAAGNENSEHVNVMATLPNVICVAGSTSADEHLPISNRGKEVSVAAPGGGWPLIAPAAPWGKIRWEDEKVRGTPGLYKHFTGTSASTPLVAGMCALLLSANPDLTSLEVKDILQKTADKIGSKNEYVNGHSIRFGHGRVNADAAVAEAMRLKNPSAAEDPEKLDNGLYNFQVKPVRAKGYGIQLHSLYEYGNVLKMVDHLQKTSDESVLIHISELKGKPIYRVIIGPFDRKKAALEFQTNAKKEFSDGFLVKLSKL